MPDQAMSAAVVFDPAARMYSVIADQKLLAGIEKEGTMIDIGGKQMTIMELCKTIAEAKTVCDERKASMKKANLVDIGFDRIVYNANGEVCEDHDATASDESADCSMDDINGVADEERYRQESVEPPMSVLSATAIRDVLENLLDSWTEDVNRMNRRYQEVREILIRHFGTEVDGSIVNTFDNHPRSLKLGTKLVHERSLNTRREREPTFSSSYFDRLVEQDDMRRASGGNRKRFYDMDDDYEDDYRPPQKRNGQIGRAGEFMRYPYLTQEQEETIFKNHGHSASAYSQSLGKILFAESLNKYFKDQDPKKREWIHEAVDFRFPTDDKNSQMLKWKNCSNAINKNMRDKERERQEVDRSKAKDVPIDYKYMAKDVEADCFDRAGGDPTKYAEYMSLRLFEKTLVRFFKEQDPHKKDWLRECVDRRYLLNDKDKRDQRWKICAAACNKNRTKVIGDDGKEDPFPYFPKEIEEECYMKCNGIPAVYCESMCRHLFPDTQHLLFKDQDIGRRNWLHDTLDKRFATPDKIAHIAKWKSCTSAVNKYKNCDDASMNESVSSKSAETPKIEPGVHKKEEKKEPEVVRERRRTELKKEEEDEVSVQNVSVSKRPRRGTMDKEEALPTTPTQTPKGTQRTRGKKSLDLFSSYPFMTDEVELDCLEKANNNPQVYARSVGRILFKDSIKLYYKDQDPARRQWMRDIVDYRFPTPDAGDQKQKWKNVTAAINKNMTLR